MRDSINADRERTTGGTPSHARPDRDRERSRNGSNRDRGAARGGSEEGRRRMSGPRAVQLARQYMEQLTGQPCESISGLVRTREGWAVMLEVVELERVPRSTDILASYRVEVDNAGELMGYERVHRYYRNQPGGE